MRIHQNFPPTFVLMSDKRTKGVFLELLPTSEKRAAWESFMLELDKGTWEQSSCHYKDYQHLKGQYHELLKEKPLSDKLNELASLEERLIQYHCLIDPQVIIGLLNQKRNNDTVTYVIARSPFYTPGIQRREIRVYMGRLDEYNGKSIDELEKDPKFIVDAKEKIIAAMLEEMKRKV